MLNYNYCLQVYRFMEFLGVGGVWLFWVLGFLVAWGDLTINNKILEMFFVEIQRAI